MIAVTMGANVITAEHISMASEIIHDNLHNLIIWLEQKRDYKASRERQADVRAWKQAFAGCKRQVHDRTKKEVVRKTELQARYAALNAVSVKTAEKETKQTHREQTVGNGKRGKKRVRFLGGVIMSLYDWMSANRVIAYRVFFFHRC